MPEPVFRAVLPALAVVAVIALAIRRSQIKRRSGRDPIVLRPFRNADTPAGWLETILAFGFPLLLLDVALNALSPAWVSRTIAVPALRSAPGIEAIGLSMLTIGMAVAALGALRMGSSWRIGIDHDAPGALVTTGLFGRVRHPIYSGLLLIVIGLACVTADLISIAVAAGGVVGIPLQARLEEEFLRVRHGDEYQRYVARTGRFWPRRPRSASP